MATSRVHLLGFPLVKKTIDVLWKFHPWLCVNTDSWWYKQACENVVVLHDYVSCAANLGYKQYGQMLQHPLTTFVECHPELQFDLATSLKVAEMHQFASLMPCVSFWLDSEKWKNDLLKSSQLNDALLGTFKSFGRALDAFWPIYYIDMEPVSNCSD